jgi:hypothetical protein
MYAASLGVDMPYNFSDSRTGMHKAMALSRYISDRYEAHGIVSTKYVFNVISVEQTGHRNNTH